jgi:hypothetical protein
MVELSNDGKVGKEKRAYTNGNSNSLISTDSSCQNSGGSGVWSNPRGIAIEANGKWALVANGRDIIKIDTGSSAANVVLKDKNFREATDVVIDPTDADKIYVSHERNVVKKYSLQSGKELQIYQFDRRIEGISVDPTATYMIVAWHNELKQVLLSNGWPIKSYTGFQGPMKPRIEPKGQFFLQASAWWTAKIMLPVSEGNIYTPCCTFEANKACHMSTDVGFMSKTECITNCFGFGALGFMAGVLELDECCWDCLRLVADFLEAWHTHTCDPVVCLLGFHSLTVAIFNSFITLKAGQVVCGPFHSLSLLPPLIPLQH